MTTHAERVPCTGSHLSDFARVKVDLAQTAFFRGREFRTFKELSIVSGSTYVVKAVVSVNTILLGVELELDDGWVRMATVAGGTSAGAYSESLPLFNRNNMSVGEAREALVLPTLSLTAGGSHTGGTELDVIRLRAASSTANAASVGAAPSDERGVAIGTYHFRLTNLGNGTATGVLRLRWEERS